MNGNIALAIVGFLAIVLSCVSDSDDAWFPFSLGIILIILGAIGWVTA